MSEVLQEEWWAIRNKGAPLHSGGNGSFVGAVVGGGSPDWLVVPLLFRTREKARKHLRESIDEVKKGRTVVPVILATRTRTKE